MRSIRERIASGEKRSELAKELGVSWTAINFIVKGRNWGHIGGANAS